MARFSQWNSENCKINTALKAIGAKKNNVR
ncbi:hypothetical protein BH10ACI3_BH10ACI3_09460 [soil metagenome]